MTTLSTTHHPTLALHLTDPALTPLLSSSSSSGTTTTPTHQQTSSSSSSTDSTSNNHSNDIAIAEASSSRQFSALTALSSSAITTYTSASRLGLGRPQRVMIETSPSSSTATSTSTSSNQNTDTNAGARRVGGGANIRGSNSSSRSGPMILHSYITPPTRERGIREQQKPSGHSHGNSNANGTIIHHDRVLEQSLRGGEPERPSTGTTEDLDMNRNLEDTPHNHHLNPNNNEENTVNNGILNLFPPNGLLLKDENNLTPDGIVDNDNEQDQNPTGGEATAPLLIATVVAPSYTQASQARRAASRLERTGMEFQRRWAREKQLSLGLGQEEGDGDAEEGERGHTVAGQDG